jgi:transmembrane sensor
MQVPKDRIQYLWDVYISRQATPQEEQELMEWIMDSDDESGFKNHMQKVWDEAEPGSDEGNDNWDKLFERIVDADREEVIPMAPVSSPKRTIWLRIAAAAIIVFCVTGTYFLLTSRKPDPESARIVQETNVNDISAPKENKAIIALSDGRIISLSSVDQGILANDGDTRLVKQTDGQIAYQKTSDRLVNTLSNNTLYNPKGSKVVEVVLADGSRVWLNSGSSLTYPVAFIGNERKVSIKGEAYFEVAHNEQLPFKVVKNGVEVTVLGTHFDVTAYDGEQVLKVSLLQGSVRVTNGKQKSLLRPGQQAQVSSGIKVEDDIDKEQVIAWKNGLFSFNNTSLAEVMQQIGRWYDVEVKYEGQVPQRHFGGKIRRSSSLNEALRILQESGVHYRVENRRIIILA